MDKEFVADARKVLERGTRELGDKPEGLSLADLRLLRRWIRLGVQLEAIETGTEPPCSLTDDRLRDTAEAVIDRVEDLGDKASVKDLSELREAGRVIHDLDTRERRRNSRRGGGAAAAEPSDLARRLLAEQNGHEPDDD